MRDTSLRLLQDMTSNECICLVYECSTYCSTGWNMRRDAGNCLLTLSLRDVVKCNTWLGIAYHCVVYYYYGHSSSIVILVCHSIYLWMYLKRDAAIWYIFKVQGFWFRWNRLNIENMFNMEYIWRPESNACVVYELISK